MKNELSWKVEPPTGLFRKYQIIELDENNNFIKVVAELPEGNTEQYANLIESAPLLWNTMLKSQEEASEKFSIDNDKENTETLVALLNDLTTVIDEVWAKLED